MASLQANMQELEFMGCGGREVLCGLEYGWTCRAKNQYIQQYKSGKLGEVRVIKW